MNVCLLLIPVAKKQYLLNSIFLYFADLVETSELVTAGCSQNAEAFNRNVYILLYKSAAAGCLIPGPQTLHFVMLS